MTRIWNNLQDVKVAITTLSTIYDLQGSLPPELVSAYRQILGRAGRGFVARFYEWTAKDKPELLKYFQNVPIETGPVFKKGPAGPVTEQTDQLPGSKKV